MRTRNESRVGNQPLRPQGHHEPRGLSSLVSPSAQLPVSRDAQLGTIFRSMRQALQVTPSQAAVLLKTKPEIVIALEAGDLHLLPPLAETVAIISRYGILLDLDVGPALRRLHKFWPLEAVRPARPGEMAERGEAASMRQPAREAQRAAYDRDGMGDRWLNSMGPRDGSSPIEAAQPGTTRPLPRWAMRTANSDDGEADAAAASKFRLRLPKFQFPRRRLAFGVGIPLAIVIALLASAAATPSAMYASLGWLPAKVSQSLSSRLGPLLTRTVTGADGLTWIVVGDPRERKADRLPVLAKR